MELVLQKIKMWLDAQKCLTQMNEDRNVENGIRGQVVCLNPPMEKKATKEIRSGKSKSRQKRKKELFRLYPQMDKCDLTQATT